MEDSLEDINTIVNKDPSISIEKKLNETIKRWYVEEYTLLD